MTESTPAPALPALTFEDAAVPDRTGNDGPNLFTDVVNGLVIRQAAKSFVLPGSDDPKTNEALRSAVRQLRAAGRDRDVTIRTDFDVEGTEKKPLVRVTFWAVERITRPRAATDAASTEGGTDAGGVVSAPDVASSPASEGAPSADDAPGAAGE